MNISIFSIDLFKIALSMIILSILGYQDWKTREISDKIVYFYLGCSTILFIASTIVLLGNYPPILLLLYIGSSLLATMVLFGILYKFNLIGDGDVYVATSIGLLYSYPFATLIGIGLLPPALIIVIYATLIGLLNSVFNAIRVLVKNRKQFRELSLKHKLIVPFLAKPVKIRDYIENRYKHHFPIQVFNILNGRVESKFNILRGINEDTSSNIKDIVEKGLVNPDTYIWITPGIPYVFHLLLGLLLYILLGDKLIIVLFTYLLLH